jgi:hypothetical protein
VIKFVSLVFSSFAVVMLASISQAATFQNYSTQKKIDVNVYGQKLIPIKKKFNIKKINFEKMIIDSQLPIDKKQNYQKIDKDERTRINCEREFSKSSVSGGQYGSNERPDLSSLNSNNPNNLDSTNRPNGCSWGFSF